MKFRYSTLYLAAVAAAAVGIPTAVEVTPPRLKLMSRSGTWPEEIKLAKSVEEWIGMHGQPLRLGEDEPAEAAAG